MSTSYQGFASLYDEFMDNIPYEEWSHYLITLLQDYHIPTGNLVELGCGTGTLLNYMANAGYDIIGIDNSIDMLSVAANKTAGNPHIHLLQQDMQQLDFGMQTFDAFYSLCDSINYLLCREDVLATFQGVKQALNPNGILIFDLKTPYFFKEILGDQVFCDHQEQGSYIWENSYFEEEGINQYDITFFSKQENGLYEKFCETHHQKAYDFPEVIDLLQLAGLKYVAAYDAFTKMPPSTDSERIYIIARNGDTKHE